MAQNLISSVFSLLLLLQVSSVFAVNPERGYKVKPGLYNIPHKETFITTPDNAKLALWIFTPEQSKSNGTTLVIAGGDAGNMSYSIYDAQQFVQQGFRVVTFDYRGFGESSAFATTREMLYYDEFCTDAEAVVRFARQNNGTDKLAMLGHSMGSIVVFTLARKGLIDVAIADGPVQDPKILAERLRIQKNIGLTYPQTGALLAEKIKKTTIPILLIAGEKDRITTLDDAKAIVAGRSNRQCLSHKGGHGEASQTLAKRYYDEISAFIYSTTVSKK
jgi:uncharacterized protein